MRSQKKLYGSSTPKSKVDACVEYDLPFDESEIAPELRRVRSPGEREISGVPEARPDIADIVNTTNLEPIDISVGPSHIENTSLSEQPTQKAQCSREEVCAEIEEKDTIDPGECCRRISASVHIKHFPIKVKNAISHSLAWLAIKGYRSHFFFFTEPPDIVIS